MREPTVLVSAKSWTESKTIMFSILSVVLPILVYAAENALALGIPDRAIPWLALFIFAVGQIILRFQTSQPIGPHGDLVPVPGARTVPDLTQRELEALAATAGHHQNEIDRLEQQLRDIRADLGLVPHDPQPPIFTEQAPSPPRAGTGPRVPRG